MIVASLSVLSFAASGSSGCSGFGGLALNPGKVCVGGLEVLPCVSPRYSSGLPFGKLMAHSVLRFFPVFHQVSVFCQDYKLYLLSASPDCFCRLDLHRWEVC